jgi:hypothetical protein
LPRKFRRGCRLLPRSFGWRYLMWPFSISFLRIWRRSRCSSKESKHRERRDDGDCRQNGAPKSVARAAMRLRPFVAGRTPKSGPSTLSGVSTVVLRHEAERELVQMRWGLIPFWWSQPSARSVSLLLSLTIKARCLSL